MRQIPDAPWIRDAEMNGYPSPEPVYCPCCEEECLEIYEDMWGNIVGCNECVKSRDANEWLEEKKEKEREL